MHLRRTLIAVVPGLLLLSIPYTTGPNRPLPIQLRSIET